MSAQARKRRRRHPVPGAAPDRELALHSIPQGRPGPGVRRLVRIPGGGDDLIGVTGTNGKTTTTYLIKAMLEGALKTRVGLIGTNRNLIGALELPAHRTTPEPYELQALLRRMADAGCTMW